MPFYDHKSNRCLLWRIEKKNLLRSYGKAAIGRDDEYVEAKLLMNVSDSHPASQLLNVHLRHTQRQPACGQSVIRSTLPLTSKTSKLRATVGGAAQQSSSSAIQGREEGAGALQTRLRKERDLSKRQEGRPVSLPLGSRRVVGHLGTTWCRAVHPVLTPTHALLPAGWAQGRQWVVTRDGPLGFPGFSQLVSWVGIGGKGSS